MGLDHKYTLICEDVRREDNGKFLVLGMFSGSIGTPQIPFAMPSLTFVSFFEADNAASYQVNFRLSHLESGTQVAEAHAMINVVRPGPVMLPLKLPNIVFQDRGTYNTMMEISGQADPILNSFTVVINRQMQIPPQMPPPPLRRN